MDGLRPHAALPLFVLFLLAVSPVGGVAGSDAPSIVFESTSHHLGAIWEGQRVSHEFRFRNAGSAELRAKGG